MEAYKDKAWQRSMKLRLDINCMMADFVGEHGLSMADIEKQRTVHKGGGEHGRKAGEHEMARTAA